MNESLKQSVGGRVREIRVAHRMTQAEFAERIDISINFLSEIENGKKGMSQETIFRICDSFQVSADYILFGTEERNLPSEKPSYPSSVERITTIVLDYSPEELDCCINYLTSLRQMKSLGL